MKESCHKDTQNHDLLEDYKPIKIELENPSKTFPLIYDLKKSLYDSYSLNISQMIVFSPFGKIMSDTDAVIQCVEEMKEDNPY